MCLALAIALRVFQRPSNSYEILSIAVSSVAFIAVIYRYAFGARHAARHISTEASKRHRSTAVHAGYMFARTVLYIFIPAAIITAILIVFGLWLNR